MIKMTLFVTRKIGSSSTKEDIPFLGICLGAQLLACSIGGSIKIKDHVEIGYYPIRPTAYGKKIIDWPPFVHQWHREWMQPPDDAKILAIGQGDEPQAFSILQTCLWYTISQ